MGRKKDQSAHEKVLFPKQKDINDSIFHFRQKKTLPVVLAITQKAEQLRPENRTKEIQEKFKNSLLKSSLFETSRNKIFFHNPKATKRTISSNPIRNSRALLNRLSLDLAVFFFKEKEKISKIEPAVELNNVLKKIISIEPFLILAKIKEKKIKEILYTIIKWNKKTYKFFNQTAEPTQIDKILVPSLIKTFRKLTTREELSDNAVYRSVAVILMHLGLEESDLKSLEAKIKTNMNRMRGKVVTK